jgi:sugar lactone lactonase YvrE
MNIMTALLLLSLSGLFAAIPSNAEQIQSAPIGVKPGWQLTVLADNLPRIDNLANGPDGALYATLERGRRQGQVVRLDQNGVTVILKGLQRPDGLAIHGQHLYVTEEIIAGRLIMVGLKSGKKVVLGNFNNPEGIAILPDGALLLTEDINRGRLIRRDVSGAITVLASPIHRPEGITIGPDGSVFIAETGAGRVIAYKNGAITVIQDGISEPDQVAIGPSGGLWVTEDRPDGRLLRIDTHGVEVIADNLAKPQGILFRDGAVHVAEQGRDRILKLMPSDPQN